MKRLRSLRWRLQIWQGMILGAVLIASGFAAYRHQTILQLRHLDRELRERAAVLVDALPIPGARPRLSNVNNVPPAARLRSFALPGEAAYFFDPLRSPAFYYVVWRYDGTEMGRSASAPDEVPMPERPPAGELVNVERTRGAYREVFSFTPHGGCLLVGRSLSPELADRRDYLRWLVIAGACVLMLGLGGSWWLTSRALRPLRAINLTAKHIAAGRLSERIHAPEPESELGEMAAVLDLTFARLEAAFAQQARFTADAAHELCTPISIIIAHAQSGLRGERSVVDCREMLDACLRAAQRMQRLTTSLLALADQDAQGRVDTACDATIDLAALARESVDLLRPVAETRQITLSLDPAAALCRGSADGISQILSNLLGNALAHTPTGGSIRVRTHTEAGHATLSVTDTGCGIAAEHLPHLFGRFYRVDASRSRRTGGVGLGLAISKAIADAHGATLEVQSEPGRGSTFTLRMPALTKESCVGIKPTVF